MQKINQLKSCVSAQKMVRDTCNIEVSVTNDHRYLFVIITIWFLAHSWFITGFITRVTGRMPHVEQELLALPEHMSSSPVFSGVCVARSSFVDLCLSVWPLYCLLQFTASDYLPLISSNSSFWKKTCWACVF